jgi:type II secretory pathway pseudopilin PulG
MANITNVWGNGMSRKPLFVKLLIGLLIAVSMFAWLVLRVSREVDSANYSRLVATSNQIHYYSTALQLYVLDSGVPPTTVQGLTVLVLNPNVGVWKGPYLRPPIIRPDAWGTPFRYRLVDTNMVVESAGPDGKFDTRDDISETIR